MVIPPPFINSPANINKGMASNPKLSNPENIFWGAELNNVVISAINKYEIEVIASTSEIGIPISKNVRNSKMTVNIMLVHHLEVSP